MDEILGSVVAENVLSLVVLVLGSGGSGDLVARLVECVSVVAIARVTDERGARNALTATKPDVAIVEMSAVWAEALFRTAALRSAAGLVCGVRMLALGETGTSLERRQSQALSAPGYLDPTCDLDGLRSALNQTIYARRPATATASSGGAGALTRREVAVVELIAEGYSNRQIGEALSISEATVKNHVHSLLGKLRITSRVQAGVAWSSGSQNGWA
jgi:DNA-binding NarL/FixJ family response regulator